MMFKTDIQRSLGQQNHQVNVRYSADSMSAVHGHTYCSLRSSYLINIRCAYLIVKLWWSFVPCCLS